MGLTQITTGGVDDNINIDSNTLKVDGTNNRVGIGTNSPVKKLNVVDTTGSDLFRLSGLNSYNLDISNANQSGQRFDFHIGSSAGTYTFNNSGGELLRIDSAGRVGIGASSPTSNRQLTLSGNDAGLQISGSGPAGANTYITLTPGSSAAAYVGTTNSRNLNFVTNGATSSRMTIDGSGNVQVSSGQFTVGTTATTGLQFINDGTFGTINNADLVFRTNATERLRLDTAGNLILKTTASAGEFIFKEGGTNAWSIDTNGANGYLRFFDKFNNSERLRITNSGNVGINISAPSDKLHVGGDIRFGTNTTYYGVIGHDAPTTGANIYTSRDTGGHIFKTGLTPSEKLRITNSGQLLINHTANTAPQGYESKLQLCDTSYQGSSLLIRRDGGSSGPVLLFAKSRATTQGGHTAVQVNDNIGTIRFFAADGTDTDSEPVQIRAQIDDAAGANDTPGRLIFSTATDGYATATEKMRLNSKGQLWVTEGHTPADLNDEIKLALRGSQPKLQIQGVGSGYTEGAVLCHAPRAARGGGIYMHNDNDGGTHIEWFAGRPYSASDFFIVSRRSGSPDIGGSTAQNSYRLLRVDNAGNLLIQGTLTQSGSDNKLKTNRTRLTSALQKVESLEGFTFNWNQDAIDNYGFSADDGTLVGMSAQELQAVLPEAVHTLTKENEVDDPTSGEDAGTREYLTIQYERVVPLLVEAIKELSTNNNALQARIAALEAAE